MSGGDDDRTAELGDEPRPPPRSRGETIFLAGVISASLITAIVFLAMTAWGIFIPAMGIAILTAIGVATLVYAFLGGGKGGDKFTVRGMQLAGAAAVFAIVIYIVNGSLDGQMNNLKLIETGRSAQSRIKAAEDRAAAADDRAAAAEDAKTAAERDRRRTAKTEERDVTEEVRAANADSELGKAVLDMWTKREGPFARTVGDEDVTARFDGRVADGGFEYCHASLPRFRDRIIRFSPRDAEAANEITLTPGADIGPICQRGRLSYSIRLGCDAARELIPDRIAACTEQGGVLWREGASREIDLYAIIINPITR